MHILLRGDLLQRLRIASGLILFTFAGTANVQKPTGSAAKITSAFPSRQIQFALKLVF